MFSFACASCGQPTDIVLVHTWMFGDPFCSVACFDRAAGAYAQAPDTITALESTATMLREAGNAVRRAIPRARSGEAMFESNSAFGGDGMFLGATAVVGLVPTLFASSSMDLAASESADGLSTELWDLDQRLHAIVRQMMLLEALGLHTAQPLRPFVQRFGGLSARTPSGMVRTLHDLHAYLEYLYGGVLNLRSSLARA